MKYAYNIMTSCNSNLLPQLKILIYSCAENLYDAHVNFFLFHRNLSEEDLSWFQNFSNRCENLDFYSVQIFESEKYDKLAFYGGNWAGEAYYSLCAHQYLPEEIDRVLYLDAGDILVLGNIAPFYYTDFQGKGLIAGNIRNYICGKPDIFYEEADLDKPERLTRILASTFNSGSYLLNLNKIRQSGITIDDYLDFAEELRRRTGKEKNIYFGDQGLLSACFLEDILYWGYPEAKMLQCTPFNFHMGWYNYFPESPVPPSIVHFVGGPKPWKIIYEDSSERFAATGEIPLNSLISGQCQWYEIWNQYAKKVESLNIH